MLGVSLGWVAAWVVLGLLVAAYIRLSRASAGRAGSGRPEDLLAAVVVLWVVGMVAVSQLPSWQARAAARLAHTDAGIR